jgi:hypothetical protein
MEAISRPPYLGVPAIAALDHYTGACDSNDPNLETEDQMQSNQRFVMCSIVTTVILALAVAIGTLSSALGVPLGAIVLGEVSAFACLVAFTMLIWAAIQDGKHPDPTAAN